MTFYVETESSREEKMAEEEKGIQDFPFPLEETIEKVLVTASIYWLPTGKESKNIMKNTGGLKRKQMCFPFRE